MGEITIEMFKDKERKNLFATYNHIEMVMVEEDHAVFRLNIKPESKNSYGMVHGGAIYAWQTTPPALPPTPMAAITSRRPVLFTSCATSLRVKSRLTPGCVTGATPLAWWRWTSWVRMRSCWPPASSPSSAWTRRSWPAR